MEGGATYSHDGCDGGQSVPSALVHLAGHSQLLRGHNPRPAATAATSPGRGKPGGGALSDQLPFELSQCPEQMERQPSRWRRSVDPFGQALEADAGGGQVVDSGDQMAQVAAEAVQAPHDKGVTEAEVVEDGLELGAVVEGARRLVRPDPWLWITWWFRRPVQLLAKGAAGSDPAVATVWEQMATKRITGMSHSARHLHQGGRLRSDVSMSKAQDVLRGFIWPELWELLRVGTTSLRARHGRNAYRRATLITPTGNPKP